MGDLDWSSGWLAGAPVRVLDTVVLDGAGAPRAWFYTSAKSGAVSTKDVAQLTWPKIGRRFARFALASPENANGPRRVAVLLRRDGARAVLGEAELAALVGAPPGQRAAMLAGVGGVQVYLRPGGGEDADYWCRVDGGGSRPPTAPSLAPPRVEAGLGVGRAPPHVAAALEETTLRLRAREAEAAGPENAPSPLEARFVRDDRGQLWLSDVSRARGEAPRAPTSTPGTRSASRAASRSNPSAAASRPGTGASGSRPRGGRTPPGASGRPLQLRPLSDGGGMAGPPRAADFVAPRSAGAEPIFGGGAPDRSDAMAAATPRGRAQLALPTPWEAELMARRKAQLESLASFDSLGAPPQNDGLGLPGDLFAPAVDGEPSAVETLDGFRVPPDAGVEPGAPPGSAATFAMDALRERIENLEAQVEVERRKASAAEASRDKTVAKCRDLGRELAKVKEEADDLVRDRDAQLELLRLELDTARNQAAVAPRPPKPAADEPSQKRAVDDLLEQLQRKEAALVDAEVNAAKQKAALEAAFAKKATQAAYQQHVAMNGLRGAVCEAQDEATALASENAALKAKLTIADGEAGELRQQVAGLRAATASGAAESSTLGQTTRAAMSLEFGAVKQAVDPETAHPSGSLSASSLLSRAHTSASEASAAAAQSENEAKARAGKG